MFSRAYILLKTEMDELQHRRNEGISAIPLTEDLMKWRAQIEGLQDSVWEGFVLDLAIYFTPEYNLVPPVVKFLTIPFHPNVDPYTGQPSIDFLDSPENWNTNYTLSSILLALQELLSNPVLENPVNLEAAQLLIKNESLYRTLLSLFVKPIRTKSKASLELPEQPHEHIKVIKSVSFNDYYKTWYHCDNAKGAISPTEAYMRTEPGNNQVLFVGDPDFMEQYYKWKRKDLQHKNQRKLKSWLTNCRFARETRSPESSSDYFVQRKVAGPSPTEFSYNSVENETSYYTPPREWANESWPEETELAESWEEEVDKIVAWTNALDVHSLDYEN
ncbi:ubiquitin-conjugating enzyme E2 U [Sigmodon hispidus]